MVAKGFKNTEIGVIPEDWEVKNIGLIVKYIKGYPFKSKDYCSDGVRVIRISDTTYNSIKDSGGIYVSASVAKETSKWILTQGDLIVSTVGSKPPMYDSMVGKVIYVKERFAGSLLNQNAVMFKNEDDGIQILLSNIFKTKRYVEYIELIFRGNANQASITLDELFKFQIALPSKKSEQKAIAEALSDADAWIANLEQMIAKKRLIKLGAMQQLLTPPSSSSGQATADWEVKKLGDIAPLQRGFDLPNRNLQYGKYPVVYSNGIVNYHNEYQVKAPGIVTGRSGTIGKVNFIEQNYWPHNTTLWVTNFNGNNPKFIYFLLLGINIRNFATGSGVPTLNRNDLHDILLSIPSLTEQTRIATILSDMDSEIETLENQLAKARQIKQGMMQELLTGRVRLV